MNREGIMRILPHRENLLLLDDVESSDGTAVGHYTVRVFPEGTFSRQSHRTRGNPL